MLHPHDPANYPTPAQEAIYERDCEIAALKEQIVEAYKIISDIDCASYEQCNAWLDQNSSIVKESNK